MGPELKARVLGGGLDNGNFPQVVGEGGPGLLGAPVQNLVAPVQNRIWIGQKTFGRLFLDGRDFWLAPSPNHLGNFPCSSA